MSELLFCENCNHLRNYTIIEEKLFCEVKGEHFEIDGKKAICNFCGEELFHFDIEKENQTKAFNAYREKHNLLKPEEIKAIREKYDLSPQDFSLLLGFSANTISRFERGSLQNPDQDRRIKECRSITKVKKLIDKNGDKLSEVVKKRVKSLYKSPILSDMEKETVIQFDEETNLATVYTASWTVARSLKKIGYTPIKKSQGGWWFKIPVDGIAGKLNPSLEEKEIVNSVKQISGM